MPESDAPIPEVEDAAAVSDSAVVADQSDQQGVIDAVEAFSSQRAVEMRSAWRNAVVAYARATNATVPSWVLEIGTRS